MLATPTGRVADPYHLALSCGVSAKRPGGVGCLQYAKYAKYASHGILERKVVAFLAVAYQLIKAAPAAPGW